MHHVPLLGSFNDLGFWHFPFLRSIQNSQLYLNHRSNFSLVCAFLRWQWYILQVYIHMPWKWCTSPRMHGIKKENFSSSQSMKLALMKGKQKIWDQYMLYRIMKMSWYVNYLSYSLFLVLSPIFFRKKLLDYDIDHIEFTYIQLFGF